MMRSSCRSGSARSELEAHPEIVTEALAAGAAHSGEIATATMTAVRETMGLR